MNYKSRSKWIGASLVFLAGFLVVFTPVALSSNHGADWNQGFEVSTFGWITDNTSGLWGWCGDIERVKGSNESVKPSEGSSYALVEFGECNKYWSENGFSDGSGPFGPFGVFTTEWPNGGYATELDIYLDPGWEEGTNFTYSISFTLLDTSPFFDSTRYLMMPVKKENGELSVFDNSVDEAGWYTFRQEFRNEDGKLGVDFKLVRDDEVIFTQPLTKTALTEKEVSSYDPSNVGTGYAWFAAISEGLKLPIDEHELFKGGM
jgi:hypothetical protein